MERYQMEKVISEFYKSFIALDAEKMTSFYHYEIVFEDPAFGILKGEHAKNMWRMLCESQKGKNFNVSFDNVVSSETNGSATWEAHYLFSQTGRKVHNKITAQFEFKDGKIIKHTDNFNLYTWSKQALGFKGYLLGWSSFFKKKLNTQTNHLLNKFERKQ